MGIPWNRLALLACLATSSVSPAQEKDSWNGIKVVTRYARPLRVDNGFAEDGTRFRIYTVKKVEDDRVRVTCGALQGWFLAGEVIPLKDAVEFYSEELRENPNNSSARNWRGIIRKETGDLDGALEDYTEAIRLSPESPHAYSNRGLVHMAKKDYDKALEDFDAAVNADPRHALARCNRATARRKKLDYAGALADVDEALRIDPKFVSALNEKAWLRATCQDDAHRNGQEAVDAASKACELADWKDANIIDTLAAAYAELGFFEQATRYQQEAIDKAPAGAPARKTYAGRLALYRKKKPYREP